MVSAFEIGGNELGSLTTTPPTVTTPLRKSHLSARKAQAEESPIHSHWQSSAPPVKPTQGSPPTVDNPQLPLDPDNTMKYSDSAKTVAVCCLVWCKCDQDSPIKIPLSGHTKPQDERGNQTAARACESCAYLENKEEDSLGRHRFSERHRISSEFDAALSFTSNPN
eukprot:m.368350 g.368350  ORF g.368350 m.368350 type:complete len:166 (-) comp16666_c1_seq41:4926-5423(-)